ncbi:hypothetical protein GSI_14707 [Ganoderma sinense ZZ0214-1]|uniref:Uncharacterized protein n=1 Tax=Ganoderma sinense ZZ0214-1 TaxID=1077348 RepID=A0A2G8RPG6_9APHY|nr:hypothetical protein GSI_14707 [Ganoderma sinense ZZ0214-1]
MTSNPTSTSSASSAPTSGSQPHKGSTDSESPTSSTEQSSATRSRTSPPASTSGPPSGESLSGSRSNSTSHSTPSGTIAGVVVGSLAVVFLIVLESAETSGGGSGPGDLALPVLPQLAAPQVALGAIELPSDSQLSVSEAESKQPLAAWNPRRFVRDWETESATGAVPRLRLPSAEQRLEAGLPRSSIPATVTSDGAQA